ncbi:fhu operon transcription regulator [Lachnospiraceae bacterium TWA4]|nr:fhu operon transcription regulator [Lachnospiraceae bacterium TWA4]
MIVEMKQLEYFIVCCDCENFSKAAQLLYTTQPNVSKVIYQMEKQLGCTLFERTSRKITLTDMGKQIYRYAVNIMENTERISDLLNTEVKKTFQLLQFLVILYRIHLKNGTKKSEMSMTNLDIWREISIKSLIM